MVVIAFLTDPTVIEKILRHLGLPSTSPYLAPARSAPWQPTLDPLPPPIQAEIVEQEAGVHPPEDTSYGPPESSSPIRPPP